ncbi:MAG: proton-conducting transporter membrane subunit [Clostridiales bacterium]|nr:proton-conducting transporter membrane subunit [Clostridiales bacterium]
MGANISLLIAVPIIFSLLFLIKTDKKYYKVLSILLCSVSAVLSIALAISGEQHLTISGNLFDLSESLIFIFEATIVIYLFYSSIKSRKWFALFLTVIMALLSIYTSFFTPKAENAILNIDKLSIVMVLIINIVGTLIVMFSIEYMPRYEQHNNIKSRQKLYYFMICIFLSAMNGLVLSDSLLWIYFFWEVTTVCSFVLISYNNNGAAINSGFRALVINLAGGICFLTGILLFKNTMHIVTLSQIIDARAAGPLFMLPVALLCIAGFTKSAQLPFQSWLLGAMVAPTPVSALLHSSTMVKAGVYLIVKLSPAYAKTPLGEAIAIYGGLTFLICSAIAITQRNAKRVLAYSTISNLGLIISSAGIGSSIAVSAAIMLIIFHSVSKALLFLCTGQIEQVIGSRDIEDMSGLIRRAPVITILAAFGMLSMILPPFGVLITKWVSIEASASNPFVTIFLILGSAFTSAFWIKWLGTILSYPVNDLRPKLPVNFTTYFPLGILGLIILGTSLMITPIFNKFVSPEVIELLKSRNQLSGSFGKVYSYLGSFNVTVIFLIIIAMFIIYLFIKKLILSPDIKKVYLCGENNTKNNADLKFREGGGALQDPVVSNLYFNNILSEKGLTIAGFAASLAIIAFMVTGGII